MTPCTFHRTRYNAHALLFTYTHISHSAFTTFVLSNFILTLPYTHSLSHGQRGLAMTRSAKSTGRPKKCTRAALRSLCSRLCFPCFSNLHFSISFSFFFLPHRSTHLSLDIGDSRPGGLHGPCVLVSARSGGVRGRDYSMHTPVSATASVGLHFSRPRAACSATASLGLSD